MKKNLNLLNKIFICIVLSYILVALCSKLGLINQNWDKSVGGSYISPCKEFIFGTDIFGLNVISKLIKGMETTLLISLSAAFISTIFGTILGIIAAYYGGYVDTFVIWIFSTISSIPSLLLFITITIVLGKGTSALFIAMISCLWIRTCRIIRTETFKIKSEDYITAAIAMGASDFRIIFKHIMPNLKHLMFVEFSLIFQDAIMTEIYLSFLGIGVQGTSSWGLMIGDSKEEMMKGVWWQMFYTTLAIFTLLFSVNMISQRLTKKSNFNSV